MVKRMSNRKIIKLISGIAIFSSLALILYMVPGLQFPIIPGISFLKLHFDEIPVLIASLLYGPFGGVATLLIKSLFKLIQDVGETGGIGVMADFIYGLALILPCSLIYKKKRSLSGAAIGLGVGFITSLLVSSILGYYLIYPLFGMFFGASSFHDGLTLVAETFFFTVDPSLTNPYDIRICFEFLMPFNLIKLTIVIVISYLSYKPLSNLIKYDKEEKKVEVKEEK